jgi:hypothetical protein
MKPFKDLAKPRTVMAISILISSGAHSSAPLAFVLHRTRIGRGAMKKFRLDWAVNLFLASSFIYQKEKPL